MRGRMVVRRARHPRAGAQEGWVVYDTARGAICDGAYLERRDAEGVAALLNGEPARRLWAGDEGCCHGVGGWTVVE